VPLVVLVSRRETGTEMIELAVETPVTEWHYSGPSVSVAAKHGPQSGQSRIVAW